MHSGPTRGPTHRLTIGWHQGELEGQEFFQSRLLGRARCEELLGTGREHAADVERLDRQPKHPVAAFDHPRPHVGQQIGQERQGARLTRCSIDDAARKPFIFERDSKAFGGTGHDFTELSAGEWRDVDVLVYRIESLVGLQPIKIVSS